MMTLTDVFQGIAEDTTDFMEKSPEEAMCDVVRTAITDAARTGRLTQGIWECVAALQMDPKDTILCILPLDTSNVTDVNASIQLLLLESVCLERDILVLKMDLAQLDSGLAFTGATDRSGGLDAFDSSCLGGLVGGHPTCSGAGKATKHQPVKTALLKACPDLASAGFCILIQHGEDGPSFSDQKLLRTFQNLAEEEDYVSNSNLAGGMRKARSSDSSSSIISGLSLESSEEFSPE